MRNFDGDPHAVSREHMLRGIELLDRKEFREALAYFDQAVALRESLSWQEEPASAWMLAAAWINRSDALRGLQDSSLLKDAIHALDRGIEAMRYVPLGGSPVFVERLILAWIKRGTACGEQGEATAAFAGFSEAETLLRTWGDDVTPARKLLSATLHTNRARFLLDGGQVTNGWQEARMAVTLFREIEAGAVAGSAGIQARGVLCRAMALLLNEVEGTARVEDWIAEATDVAEEALALVKSAELIEPWMADFVRYGARIYRVCQPQFLGEFLVEWLSENSPLANDPVLKKEMKREIQVARWELARRVRLHPQDAEVLARQMKILQLLEAGETGTGPA